MCRHSRFEAILRWALLSVVFALLPAKVEAFHHLKGANLYALPPSHPNAAPSRPVGPPSLIKKIALRIKREPVQILSIPFSSAFVGWLTNWLAVQMIFYPLEWHGIPLLKFQDEPFGILGWQGIVPAKTGKMASRMVDMVTSQLLSVQEVFERVDPTKMALLLEPEIGSLAQDFSRDGLPKVLHWLPDSIAGGLSTQAVDDIRALQRRMLKNIVRDLQQHSDAVLDVKDMVVQHMLEDRSLLVQLFQKCGSAEFPFLVNSGLWVGFLLGVGQMLVWCLYSKPWTLPVGGAIVGYLTNWIALKMIFEPVEPLTFGPFIFQGLFLRRQAQVGTEFASFFATRVLTSRSIWKAMMFGVRSRAFFSIIQKHVAPFVRDAAATAGVALDSTAVQSITRGVTKRLPQHIHAVHEYMDNAMDLENTLSKSMNAMPSRDFESVLHPVFQEDELTLIVAGGVLGGAVGLLQLYWSTEETSKVSFGRLFERFRRRPKVQESSTPTWPD